jgi:hypothetical protein
MCENASFQEPELMDPDIDEKLKQEYLHGGPDCYYKLLVDRVTYSLTHVMAL